MSKGVKYRTAIKLVNWGIRLRWVWLMEFGNEMKRKVMGEYI